MLNPTQELVGTCHVSSSIPTYHAQSRHGSGGDREFSFWCASSNAESSRNDCFKLLGRSGEGTGFKSKHSTLIPRNPHCCSVSQNSRSQAIAESRKELMQKLQELPESAFELSFQYLVQQQQQQALQPNQILRVESMDNENFLLKMFFPSSLDWKKKAKVGSVPKLSPASSFHNSFKQIGKEQRMKSSQAGDNRSDQLACIR